MKKILIAVIVTLALYLFTSIAHAQVIFPNRGGTGTTTIPTTGYVLVGQPNGTYGPQPTSTLGFGSGGGSGTVTSVGLTVPTGFTVTGTPVTTAGDFVIAFAAGYTPVLTSSTTEWSSFYVSPSTRITAGTGIDWSSNTLNVTLGDFTTANLSENTNLYYTDSRARQALSEDILGLAYNSSTGVFSTSSGYFLPTTTRAANWDTAFGWGNHAIQGYITSASVPARDWISPNGYLTPSTSIGISIAASSTIQSLTTVNSTGTNATTTNLAATSFKIGSDVITDITGAGLQITSNALTLNATGEWTGTLDGFEGAIFNNKVSSTSIDTSSELAALLTDETGSGFSVFSASPVFTGTPTFVNLFATGTTTLGFASSTALTVANNSYLNTFTANSGTTTNASSTNLFATNASTSRFFGAGLSSSCNGAGFKVTYGVSGLFGCETDQTGGGSAATGTTLVCASGCPYSSIQTAIDAGVRNIQLKEETYTGAVQIKFSDTKITGAGATSTVISCDAPTLGQPCFSVATTTRLTRIIVRDLATDNSNATFAGTGFDFSDTSKVYASNIRSTDFNIGILYQDTTNSSFYSHFENLDVYASSTCFKTGGTKSNDNSIDTARCITTAANSSGIGYWFIDSEGWILNNINSEPGSLLGTGLYVDGTSIGITVINPWFEGNATGTEIRAGALNTSIKGGRITASTVGLYDGGTNTFLDSALISANTTNIVHPSSALGVYVNPSSAFSAPFIGVGTSSQSTSFTRLALGISTSDATANMMVLNNAGAFATAPAGLLFTHSSGAFATGTARIYANPGSGYTNANVNIAVSDSAKQLRDRLSIDVDGDVGIGTTSPVALLTVLGQSAQTRPLFRVASSTGSTTFEISPYGMVSIGTSTTNAQRADLVVYNNDTSGGRPSIYLGGNPNGDTDFFFARTNTNDSTDNDRLDFGKNLFGASSTIMTLLYNLNVGIGSSTPSRTLTVNGDYYGANITATGSLIARASSTIGGGTGATGLTVDGTATSTNAKVTSLTASSYFCAGADRIFTSTCTSAFLASSLSDETGTGVAVFGTNPLLTGFRSSASSTIGDGTATGGLTVSGSATTTGTSTVQTAIIKGNGTATSTAYIYSTTAGLGGQIILEDSDAAGCSGITALNGVLTVSTVTCPPEY